MNWDSKVDGRGKKGRTQLMLYFLPKQAASRVTEELACVPYSAYNSFM